MRKNHTPNTMKSSKQKQHSSHTKKCVIQTYISHKKGNTHINFAIMNIYLLYSQCTKWSSHSYTDKRAAHDNGLHLQSDTHHTYKERKMVSWHNIILTSIYWREKYFFCKRLISFPSMVTSLANPLIFSHSGLKIEQILPSDVMNDTFFERKNICDVS